jgi:FkbM family methyltransferase
VRAAIAGAAAHATDTCKRIWRHPENRGRRARTLGLYFAWQAWERTVKRPWTIPLVPGRVIRCYPHCQVSSGTLYYRLPERSSMRFLLAYLKPGDTMIDVGANVGTYSLLATTIDDVFVVAFEPSGLAYERAARNVDLNRVEGRTRLFRQAVGAASGVAILSVGLGPRNKVLSATEAGEEVPMTTLDELRPSTPGPVSLVKVDVEGGELDVLEGGRQLIERDSPALILEVNDPSGTERQLKELGYSCYSFDADSGALRPTTVYDNVGLNVIALRDLDSAAARLRRSRG